eukprot:Skav218921  [mRNA]  locus=scaffold2606:110338:113479:- [translate_table: standard]
MQTVESRKDALRRLPKYTIRHGAGVVGLIWLVPVGTLLLGCFHWTPLLLALLLTPLEVPKVRSRLFGGRAKKLLPCLKVPALLRLSLLWVLQVWFIILWRANASNTEQAEAPSEESDLRISVVLPCAGEGLYALNTVRAVYESLPPGVLHEIIVVDDGTEPPLSQSYLTPDVLDTFQVTILRHVPWKAIGKQRCAKMLRSMTGVPLFQFWDVNHRR